MSEKVNFYGSEWERKRDVGCLIHVSVYVYGLCRALVAFLSSLMVFCFVPLQGPYFTGTNKAIVGHVYRCLAYFSLMITLSYSPGGISFAVDWKMKKLYRLFSVWFFNFFTVEIRSDDAHSMRLLNAIVPVWPLACVKIGIHLDQTNMSLCRDCEWATLFITVRPNSGASKRGETMTNQLAAATTEPLGSWQTMAVLFHSECHNVACMTNKNHLVAWFAKHTTFFLLWMLAVKFIRASAELKGCVLMCSIWRWHHTAVMQHMLRCL